MPISGRKRPLERSSFGDPRRRRRVVQMATHIAQRPDGSFPKHMQGDWASLKGAYRLFNDGAISFVELAKPVWQQTREQARQAKEPVLLVQETSRQSILAPIRR